MSRLVNIISAGSLIVSAPAFAEEQPQVQHDYLDRVIQAQPENIQNRVSPNSDILLPEPPLPETIDDTADNSDTSKPNLGTVIIEYWCKGHGGDHKQVIPLTLGTVLAPHVRYEVQVSGHGTTVTPHINIHVISEYSIEVEKKDDEKHEASHDEHSYGIHNVSFIPPAKSNVTIVVEYEIEDIIFPTPTRVDLPVRSYSEATCTINKQLYQATQAKNGLLYVEQTLLPALEQQQDSPPRDTSINTALITPGVLPEEDDLLTRAIKWMEENPELVGAAAGGAGVAALTATLLALLLPANSDLPTIPLGIIPYQGMNNDN